MPTSKPANHSSRVLLLAGDSKNTVLAEMAGSTHRFAYSPYGQQSSRQEVRTRLGFNGELREAQTDWYFLGNGYRVYNSRLMRFQSYDKFSPFEKGGLNGFAYCGCEPMVRADPTGEGWFKLFAYFWEVISPAGTGGSVGRTTKVPSQAKRGAIASIVTGVAENQKTPFLKNSKTTLGRSKPQMGLPKGSTPSTTTSSATQTGAGATPIKYKHTKFVLEGNYGVRPQNEYTTVRTRDGLRISGTDSGTRQFPSSSRGIRASAVSDIRGG
ncbi:RHS repeat-associated core domain-containing protein [Pseudomonas sp. C1C7]|uniref:RHS repeat-associated core domain-containing protein n=1 Tax=Pseudomonas sp. C1C7 TaxID=2735272 RepID=UPI0015862947|nr:RHS repeat-associated core domain-containing protein [Pseudomonas sp. C1C7]NUT78387.1 RHS repeat-associated core domain-containing protein [Pseudomonas sp. C1C7]